MHLNNVKTCRNYNVHLATDLVSVSDKITNKTTNVFSQLTCLSSSTLIPILFDQNHLSLEQTIRY